MELGLNVYQLAKSTGIPESHLRNVLEGRKNLSVHYFARLALEMRRVKQERGDGDLSTPLFQMFELMACDETFERRREKRSLDGERRSERHRIPDRIRRKLHSRRQTPKE